MLIRVRRLFTSLMVVAVVGAAGAPRSRGEDESPSARRPNLVFVLSDQHSWDMLGCYGNRDIITPNFDRLADEGVRFDHCISNSPVCTPYRGILMTGQHSLNSGAMQNDLQMLPGEGNYLGEGKPVKIVSWGDSVTVGGDASSPETRYTAVFQKRLGAKFPSADVTVETIAVGGSNSRQWLYPDRFPGSRSKQTVWQRIADAKPDLVTIEFVNDAGMTPQQVDLVYIDILRRLQKIGAEVIFITPHFTRPAMMRMKSLREPDRRLYVLAMRAFADRRGLAVADASSRWAHLWKEGLPYVTLLRNGINHPDDRGHALFADELMRCFE